MAKHGEASKENDSSRTNNEGRKGIETVCATRRTVKGKEKASSKVALAQKRKTPSVEQHSDSDSVNYIFILYYVVSPKQLLSKLIRILRITLYYKQLCGRCLVHMTPVVKVVTHCVFALL